MRLRDGAQICMLAGRNILNPFAMYITEILETEGFCYDVAEAVENGCDLLIVPDITLTQKQRSDIDLLAKSGGNLLSLRPKSDMLPLFGLASDQLVPYTWPDRYLRTRDGEVLQYHGPASLVRAVGAEALAWLQAEFEAGPSEYPAAVRFEDGGRRAAFTFDLAQAVVLFHQGRADQASNGPNPDPDGIGVFRMNNMFINHLDPRCKMMPQADLLQDLLVEMIDWATAKTAPVPRVWHFPDAEPGIAFLNGDSDTLSREDLDLCIDISEAHGCKYTLYMMLGDFGVLSPDDAAELRRRGHDFGVHPWLGEAPEIENFAECLRSGHADFVSHYGYLPATNRNHYVVSPGWVDTPAVLADIGVRMDLNPYAARDIQCGYMTGTGLPMKLMDQSGKMIDIYRQCTLHSDDCTLTDYCNLPAYTPDEAFDLSRRMIDDVYRRYQGVYQVCFHPIRLKSYGVPAAPWYDATAEYISSIGMLTVSGQEWCDFNDARRSVKIRRDGDGWRLTAERPVKGLTLLWPERVASLTIDGRVKALKSVGWGGITSKLVVLDAESHELNIQIEVEG